MQPSMLVRNFRDVSMRDVKKPIVTECLLQYAVKVFAVGIGDENLPEVDFHLGLNGRNDLEIGRAHV